MKKEWLSGGTLDPQGLYGAFVALHQLDVCAPTAAQCFKSLCVCAAAGVEKRTVELKNSLPTNIVPNTAVERQLTINGEMC